MPYLGGSELVPLNLVLIIPANATLGPQLLAFAQQLGASAWWQAVGPPYGLTTLTASEVSGPAITSDVSQSQIESYIGGAIDGRASTATTLFLLYLPDGVDFSDNDGCSYHATYTGEGALGADGFAVVGRSCFPDTPGESELDYLTRNASHEVFEAATDPTDDGWTLGGGSSAPWNRSVWAALQTGEVELADLCEGTRMYDPQVDGGWEYQRMWSNAGAAAGGDPCTPALTEPYFSVFTSQDWFAVAAGASIQVALTGWSAGSTADWLVRPELLNGTAAMESALGSGDGPLVTDLGAENQPGCHARDGMNAGHTGTLSLTAPAGARSGDWAVIGVDSFHEEADTCAGPLTEDSFHMAPVGIYVP